MKFTRDVNHSINTRSDLSLEVGDLVWWIKPQEAKSRKLEREKGPYIIVESVGSKIYIIEDVNTLATHKIHQRQLALVL